MKIIIQSSVPSHLLKAYRVRDDSVIRLGGQLHGHRRSSCLDNSEALPTHCGIIQKIAGRDRLVDGDLAFDAVAIVDEISSPIGEC